MMQKRRCEDKDVVHLNLACGQCGDSIGMQGENYHWHLVDEKGNPVFAYHATHAPPTSGHCQ